MRAEQGYINVNVVAIANVTASSILDTQVCSTKTDGWSVVRFWISKFTKKFKSMLNCVWIYPASASDCTDQDGSHWKESFFFVAGHLKVI